MDIVYLWVDGNHPSCRSLRARHGVHTPYQSSNHDELQFSLLSVYRYASWARRIIVVSENGVRPEWANRFPRVEWLDQDRVLPAHAAPAFNNMVLEAYLHRIPNVSDPFLYFNDDYFLGKPVSPAMWLEPQWTFFRGHQALPRACARRLEWMSMTVRTADLCQARWGTARATYLQHTPYLVSGEAMEAVLREYHKEIDQMVQRHSKRHPDDVVPILLMQEWLLHHKPRRCRTAVLQKHTTPSYYFANVSPQSAAAALQGIRDHSYHFVTLNDNFGSDARVAALLQAALHRLLPSVHLTNLQTREESMQFTLSSALAWVAAQPAHVPFCIAWGMTPEGVRRQWSRWRGQVPAALAWDAVLLRRTPGRGWPVRQPRGARLRDWQACWIRPPRAAGAVVNDKDGTLDLGDGGAVYAVDGYPAPAAPPPRPAPRAVARMPPPFGMIY